MLTGLALLFHPDLLHGTSLEQTIVNYTFFDYRIHEALHMSEEEHNILVSLMIQMKDELQKNHDELQNAILVGYIELTLNFCQRFYNRQFITRRMEYSDILMRFNGLLHHYYEAEIQWKLGLPTVQYCADKLCNSAKRIYLFEIKRVRRITSFWGNELATVLIAVVCIALLVWVTLTDTKVRIIL